MCVKAPGCQQQLCSSGLYGRLSYRKLNFYRISSRSACAALLSTSDFAFISHVWPSAVSDTTLFSQDPTAVPSHRPGARPGAFCAPGGGGDRGEIHARRWICACPCVVMSNLSGYARL